MTAATYSVFGLVALGCSAQRWAANSLSRWASNVCFISFRDSRTSALEGLKHPVTLGATEALKVSFLNPYPLAWHCRSISLTMCKREQCAAASAAFRGWRSVTNSMLVTLLRGGVHLILANPPWRQLQERAERFRETRSTWG